MRRALYPPLALLTVFLLSRAAFATTWRDVEVTCPIDGTKINESVPGSTSVSGRNSTFRPESGLDWVSASLIRCPECGFVGHLKKYEEADGLDRDKLRAALKEMKTSPFFRVVDGAIVTEKNWENSKPLLAHLSLVAKWRADDTGEPDLIDKRNRAAITAHMELLKSDEMEEEARPQANYLLGELHRQSGNLDEALRWLDEALKTAPAEFQPLIKKQRSLIGGGGERSAAEILSAAKAGDNGDKLAAIALLREATDEATIDFLKEFCLGCPEDLRERAMEALGGPHRSMPLEHHLPIYLDAIGNDHFRTVQGGAYSAALLGAREAAPLIVKALKNPIQNTETVLWRSLAMTASGNEVDFLIEASAERRSHEIFWPLVNSGSPKAVPLIIKLLEKDGYSLASFVRGDRAALNVLKSAAGFDALMKALPDLVESDPDSFHAVLRVQILWQTEGKEALDQLAVGVGRGGKVAFHAARALLDRGDSRGKTHAVKILPEYMRHDGEYDDLLPFLEPGDFPAIKGHLDGIIEEKRERIRDLRNSIQEHGDKLNEGGEPDLKEIYEDMKERAEKDLERALGEENWWMDRWLRLLGATGHPDALPLLLEFSTDANRQARSGAIDGLGFHGSEGAGKRLIGLLEGSNDPGVAEGLVLAIGRLDDPQHAELLIQLVEQPTSVPTKLAWINTMTKLAPAKATPFLEAWEESPNEELAGAAQNALASGGNRTPSIPDR